MATIKDINFREPRYMLPAILYFPLIGLFYLICNIFNTEIVKVDNSGLEKTEYLNDKLPDANYRGDGIGTKMDNMLTSFGKISDLSAIEGVEKDTTQYEEFESKYTDEDLMFMLEQQRTMLEEHIRDSIRQSVLADGIAYSSSTDEHAQSSQSSQTMALQLELEAALERIRAMEEQNAAAAAIMSSEVTDLGTSNAVTAVTADEPAIEVVRKVKVTSDYFNSISAPSEEGNIIKAIIDEDVKAVDGSRVRLRLLDDIEVSSFSLPKGSYIYATMSGFSSQRVQGKIQSVMAGDQLIKINLNMYDTDGLPGLYVPESKFRETGKDVASSAFQSTMTVNRGGSTDDALNQWALQGLQNATQRTTNALGNAIRKNQVKLKYGTIVYLINDSEIRNNY